MLQQAIQAFQDGNFDSADLTLKRVLQVESKNLPALHILGLIKASQSKYGEAADYLTRAARIHPNDASIQYNLAKALADSGNDKDALTHHKKAVALAPNNPEAWLSYGKSASTLGRYEDALVWYGNALSLKPDYAEAALNKGATLKELKRYEEAIAFAGRALEINPNLVEAWSNKGTLLNELKRYDEAIAHYDQALKLKPDYAEAWSNKGAALHELKQYDEAIAHYDQALKLKPDYAEAWSNKGASLGELKRYDEAIAQCDQALKLKPDYAEAWYNKGASLGRLKRYDEAIAQCDQALKLKPDYAEAWYNKGASLGGLKRYDEAIAHYDQALKLESDFQEAAWNRALVKLLLGNYEEGWELHELRWKTDALKVANRSYQQPLWLGKEPLIGKTILIWAEQGLGDTIQFCRYIKMVADLGARVIFEVQEPLLQSLLNLEGVSELIPLGKQVPYFDFHCPLLSLPLAFKTTVDTIPNRVPYLNPDLNKLAYWKAKLGEKHNLRVGLVWSGGFRLNQPETWHINERRNIPLSTLEALNVPKIDFYSLQKGIEAEAELETLQLSKWGGPNIIDFTKELIDYSDTAALIANLDLVISVDTSVAHMTGAVGKPIWILNRFDTCWRWFVDKSDSPWYPTATIFNQATNGDWESVVDDVRIKLIELATHT